MSKTEIKSGLNTKTLVVGVILVVILSFFRAGSWNIYAWPSYEGSVHGRSPRFTPWAYTWDMFMFSFGIATIMILCIAIINQVKHVFSRQEVTILLVMILCSMFLNSALDGSSNLVYWLNVGIGMFSPTRGFTDDIVAKMQGFLPSFMGMNDKEYWVTTFSTWWSPIRWDLIMPMIVYTTFLCTVLFLIGLFTILFLRRLYIDVEDLPFPIANLANDMVDLTQPSSSKVGFLRSKWFLVGFLVQAIWILSYNLPYRFIELFAPGTASPFDFNLWSPGNLYLVYDATVLALVPWVGLNIMLEPWTIAWGTLLSMDVLIGAIIGWFAVQFLPGVVLTAIGTWPEFPTGQMSATPNYRLYYIPYPGGSANVINLWFGMIIGLAVVPILKNLDTMIPIFKGFVKEPAKEVDPERPLSYRIVLWGFIASLLLYVVACSLANVLSLWSFVWIVLIALLMMGSYRLIAETGGVFGHSFDSCPHGNWAYMVGIILLTIPLPGLLGITPTTSSMVMTYWFISGYSGALLFTFLASSGTISLESFKMGKMSNTNLKDILKAVIISIVIGVFVYCAGNYIWLSIYPGNQWAGAIYPWIPSAHFSGFLSFDPLTIIPWVDTCYSMTLYTPNTWDAVGKMLIGFVVVAGLTIGRERFPWLRISAAGLCLGVFGAQWLWSAFIVALIIKFLIMRVGGPELFKNKWKPLATGLLVGFLFAYVVNGLLYVPAFLATTYT